MKRFKLFVSVLLVISLIAVTAIRVDASPAVCNGYTYVVQDGAAEIIRLPWGLTRVVIPSELDGYPVKALGVGLFEDYGKAEERHYSVVVPDSVEVIRNFCFASSFETANMLDSVELPESIRIIEDGAFFESGLYFDALSLPNLESVEESAFRGCSIRSLTLGSHVEVIGKSAFEGCGIEELRISGVREIGSGAFQNNSITHLELPENLETIRLSAFRDNQITELRLPAGLKYLEGTSFYGNPLTSVEISEGLLAMAPFQNSSGITTLTVPDSLIFVQKSSFSRYKEVMGDASGIAAALCQIGGVPFRDKATGELLPPPTACTLDGMKFLVSKEQAWLTEANPDEMPENLVIPAEVEGVPVTMICGEAFQHCGNLKTVVMPDSVRWMEDKAFSQCGGLQYLGLSEGLQVIMKDSIFSCGSLHHLYIPDSLELVCKENVEQGEFEVNPYLLGDEINIIIKPGHPLEEMLSQMGGSNRVTVMEADRTYILAGDGLYSTEDGSSLRLEKQYLSEQYTYLPDTVNGLPVTEVGPYCCWYIHWDDPVLFLGGQTRHIMEKAFSDHYPFSVVIPRSVDQIDENVIDERALFMVYPGSCGEKYAKSHSLRYALIREMPFTDVTGDGWYYDAVLFCYRHGIMRGTSETTFEPKRTLTRAELVQVFYNLMGDGAQDRASGFSDVPETAWYAPAVTWASANGIVNGSGNGKFSPNGRASREQVLTILYRAFGGTPVEGDVLEPFADRDKVSPWAYDAVSWAVAMGYARGSDGQLNPGAAITRAELAQIMYNCFW